MPTDGRDYGYSNARLKGMKSHLLPMKVLEDLLHEPQVSGIMNRLANTPYRLQIEQASLKGDDASAVDEALRLNLAADYRKVLGFLNEEAYELALTVLGRFDVMNIKTVLRGKHVQIPPDEVISNFIPAGRLTDVELQELVRQPDIRACIDLLATWEVPYARTLMQEMRNYVESEDLSYLELAIDKHYFADAEAATQRRGANAELARRMVQTQIDVVNLLTILRMLKADLEATESERMYIAGGGQIGHDMFVRLSQMSDIDELLDQLRGTGYGRILEEALVPYLEQGSLSVLERALEQMLMKRTVGLSHKDPLGLGVVLAYVFLKQNEVTNLRIIVKGKAVGMPERRIREELVLV